MYRRTIQRRITKSLAAGLALAAGALLGQAPAAKTAAFEVATIRAAPPAMEVLQQLQSGKAKIGMTVDEGRVDMGFQSPADLMRIGFRVRQYQIQGPDWMAQPRFEIQAKIPAGVSKDLVPEMLQTLLAERFKLTYHREKKELPVYELIVGKGGLKLTESPDTPEAPLPDSPGAMSIGTEKGPMKIVQDGKGGSEMQGGAFSGTVRQSIGATGIHLEITKAKMAELVDLLTGIVDKPVVDMTDLKGSYQVTLDLPMDDLMLLAQRNAAQLGIQLPTPPQAAGANPADLASTPGGAAIFQAIEKMGLKLDARKAPVDVIVVDHLERAPTEN
jgi:uncharacterized protein (TIGR03435 family)